MLSYEGRSPVRSASGCAGTTARCAFNALEVRNLVVRYRGVAALDGISLVVPENNFVTLLGPSGCGKTSLLRAIAGLVQPSSGEIVIKDQVVSRVPIHRRNIGLVFQNYALFPHKSVFDNIAFGLKYRKFNRDTTIKKVERALAAVQLSGVAERMPSQLSGGQQQRVALARALVIEPDLLLLDEPLSALDANLREQMRVELKQIQRRFGIATVFVTHDQEEALALSDTIVVMNNARIEQIGAPEDVYCQPTSTFVANFIGQSNLIFGRVAGIDGLRACIETDKGRRITAVLQQPITTAANVNVAIKAHSIKAIDEPERGGYSENVFSGVVESVSYLGGTSLIIAKFGGIQLRFVSNQGAGYSPGHAVHIFLPPEQCIVLTDGS